MELEEMMEMEEEWEEGSSKRSLPPK